MNTYIFDFMGQWPVGAYIAVVDDGLCEAFETAKEEVAAMGFNPESVTFMRTLAGDQKGYFVISNGDY